MRVIKGLVTPLKPTGTGSSSGTLRVSELALRANPKRATEVRDESAAQTPVLDDRPDMLTLPIQPGNADEALRHPREMVDGDLHWPL